MAKILFLTVDGGGNVSPALIVAAALAKRGHDVCFLGHRQQAGRIESAGFRFEPYQNARAFSAITAKPGLASTLAWMRVFTDHGPGADAAAFAEREGADLVVVDCLLGGAFAAIKATGVPTVMFMHTFIRFWTAQWRGPIGLVTRLARSNPMDAEVASILLTTMPALDPIALSRGIPAERVAQVGAVLPPISARSRKNRDRKRLLVSLSTISQPGQRELLQRVLDAVAELPVDVTLTTGPAIMPSELRVPANVDAQAFVSHSEIMPNIDLVVGHGGHGTTMLALAHSLPLVMFPLSPMIDQPMVANAVAAAGAGIVLPKNSTIERIRDAIAGVLADTQASSAAGVIAKTLRAGAGAEAAADHCESLIRASLTSR